MTDREPPIEGRLRYVVSASEIADLLGATQRLRREQLESSPCRLPAAADAAATTPSSTSTTSWPGPGGPTPRRGSRLSAKWWWEKTVDAVRAVVDLPPTEQLGEPAARAPVAVVLLHAALHGDVPGVRASATAVAGRRPGRRSRLTALDDEARRLEDAVPSLRGLLVEPLGGGRRPSVGAVRGSASPRRRPREAASRRAICLEVVLEQVSPAVHRRQVVTTTADDLGDRRRRRRRSRAGRRHLRPVCRRRWPAAATVRAPPAVPSPRSPRSSTSTRPGSARTRFLLEPVTVAVGEPGYDSVGEDQFPALRADVVVADPPVAARASLVGWVDHVARPPRRRRPRRRRDPRLRGHES